MKVIGLLLVTAIISLGLYFRQAPQNDTVDIQQFPKSLGDWASVDLPITSDQKAILETDNVFVRRYTHRHDGREVYLFIVYSQHNRKVAHPPEVCYAGSGMSVLDSVKDKISVGGDEIEANRLRLGKKGSEQIINYWFKVGDRFTANYWKQQALVAFYALIGRPAGSALVRISADVVNHDPQNAAANIKVFTTLVVPELSKYLP